VVLRLLRGEPVDAVSREVAVPIYKLEQWRDRALAGIDAGLTERENDPEASQLDDANRRIGHGSQDPEKGKAGKAPFGQPKGVAMSRAISEAAAKPYDLERVCRVLDFSRSTIYVQQARESTKVAPLHPMLRGPKPTVPNAELLVAIRADLGASPFTGEGHCKVWARLRILSNIRVSRARVLRLMRENAMLSPHRRLQGNPVLHDGSLQMNRPNDMFGTDGIRIETVDEGGSGSLPLSIISVPAVSAFM
jgi:hypothetical protein